MSENDYIAALRARNSQLFAGGDETLLQIKAGKLELLLRQAFCEGARSVHGTAKPASSPYGQVFDDVFAEWLGKR